jgi:hypothetical protein
MGNVNSDGRYRESGHFDSALFDWTYIFTDDT